MIAIDHLTKRYRNITVVDGLSFESGPGRVTGFLGPDWQVVLRRDVTLTHPPSGGAPHRAPPLATPAEPTLRNHHQRTARPFPV
jgi:ABC-2 type transport system ATP-binding protein